MAEPVVPAEEPRIFAMGPAPDTEIEPFVAAEPPATTRPAWLDDLDAEPDPIDVPEPVFWEPATTPDWLSDPLEDLGLPRQEPVTEEVAVEEVAVEETAFTPRPGPFGRRTAPPPPPPVEADDLPRGPFGAPSPLTDDADAPVVEDELDAPPVEPARRGRFGRRRDKVRDRLGDPADGLPPVIESEPVVEPQPVVEPEPVQKKSSGWLVLPLLVVAAAAVAAIVGVVTYLPSSWTPAAFTDGTSERVRATVDDVTALDCDGTQVSSTGVPSGPGDCLTVAFTTASGGSGALTLDGTAASTPVEPGDAIVVQSTDGVFTLADRDRRLPVAIAGVLLLGVAALVARGRGLRAVVAVGAGLAGLVGFVLPALRDGHPPALVAASAVTLLAIVAAYLVHGVSRRTTAGLVGTLVGLGLVGGLGYAATELATLTGVASDTGRRLALDADATQVAQVTVAAALVAGLGVLLDVTARQSGFVWAARDLYPQATRRELARTAATAGREHAGSTLLVIAFAFTGAALIGLLASAAVSPTPFAFAEGEAAATELLRAAACGIGVLLAIPVTTWIAARMVPDTVPADDEDLAPLPEGLA